MTPPSGGLSKGCAFRQLLMSNELPTPPEALHAKDTTMTEREKTGALTRNPLSPTWPLEMLSTITFAEQAGKTTVTVQWSR